MLSRLSGASIFQLPSWPPHHQTHWELHLPAHPLAYPPQAEKDCDALRAEINRVAQQAQQQETAMAEKRAEIQQLQNVIAEADQVGCKKTSDTQ